MRRIIALVLALLLLAVTASAQAPYVADNAGLMTRTAANTLETEFSRYHTDCGFTVAAVTVAGLEGKTAEEYAAQVYKNAGYGNDGVLLLICETEGQWYLYTSGLCAEVISDEDAAGIGESLQAALESGDYYGALQDFAKACAEPVCRQVEIREAEAKEEQKLNKIYLILGMLTGLVLGVLVAALLAGKIKLPKPAPKKKQQKAEPEEAVETLEDTVTGAVEEAAEVTMEEDLTETIGEISAEPAEELQPQIPEQTPDAEEPDPSRYVALDDILDDDMMKLLDEIMGQSEELPAAADTAAETAEESEESLEKTLEQIIGKIMQEEA